MSTIGEAALSRKVSASAAQIGISLYSHSEGDGWKPAPVEGKDVLSSLT